MQRPARKRCKSLEDTKNVPEKRPRMEFDQIQRYQWNASPPATVKSPNDRARPKSHEPPLHDRDFTHRTGKTVCGTNAPQLGVFGTLRNHRSPLSATSDTSLSVGSDAWSVAPSNPDSRAQSPASSATSFKENCCPNGPGRLPEEPISPSPLSAAPETYSESPSCSLSSEESEVHPSFEHNLTSAVAESSLPPSPMDIPETSYEMEFDAINSSGKQRLAIDDAALPNSKERTQVWVMSSDNPDVAPHRSLETSPDHHTKEEYPATKTICKDSCSSDVDNDSILPEYDVQRPSKIQAMYTPMETDPRDFGPNSTTIASLPECILAMIMTFCIEPKDLLALIRSSPVFLQPFCKSRLAIVSPMIKHMKFRFGGDMPRSGLMAARLRNRESKGAAMSSVRKVSARRVVQSILSFSEKGPLLHPFYSLRQLRFISDTLDKAESLMSCYAIHAWARVNAPGKLGPSHTADELVLSKTERKRFMDTFCLYDAFCTAFFSENTISTDGNVDLRQIFLEDSIPSETIKRFYSIVGYLHLSYRDWIYMAIDKSHYDPPAMCESRSQFPHLEKHINPLIHHFICSGPSAFRMLQDMTAFERYSHLINLLGRCETDTAFLQMIRFAHGRGDIRFWPHREIAAGLTKDDILTAQHFWDPATPCRVEYISRLRLKLPHRALSARISSQPQVSTANNTSSP